METKEVAIRILVAIIIGASIGAEREYRKKPAGFITITLVCFGAATCAILEELLLARALERGLPIFDYTRITAQVISGIGFLGAGVIFHNSNTLITGLTTASIVWVSACLGLLTGYGYISISLAFLFAIMAILLGMRSVEVYLKDTNRL